jgi:hypothetical protein
MGDFVTRDDGEPDVAAHEPAGNPGGKPAERGSDLDARWKTNPGATRRYERARALMRMRIAWEGWQPFMAWGVKRRGEASRQGVAWARWGQGEAGLVGRAARALEARDPPPGS